MSKPGIKSTEFYMAMAVVLLGALASVYAEQEWAKAAGMVAAALASAGYGFARSKIKSADSELEASMKDTAYYAGREQIQADKEVQLALIKAKGEQK